MDRIIEVKVNGSYITKDNRNAGVQHEANSTSLRIEFDPSWDSYAKKITWWNAKGEDPVEITLGTDLLEDAAASTRIYLCLIPGEPLAECGECTFVIDGYVDGKRQRSAADRLWVKEAPFKETAGQPSDPTPSQAEQLQAEIDGIKDTISQAVASKNAAAESAAKAKASETAAAGSASEAAKSESAAAESAASAAADASGAAKSAGAAAQSEQNAKASETATASSETTASSAATAAAQAKTVAESAQVKAEKAQAAAESAKEAAETAQGKAESAQTAAEAAKDAAESSEANSAASEKTAQSWAVGGTGTRDGEDINNAKYWSERASAIVGGDFATKAEAQGYVETHNQSSAAHADLRQAIAGKENAGAAEAVQQELDTHIGDTTIHITEAERTAWNGKEAGGAAAAVQQNLTAHIGDTVKHVTAAERTKWNGKADLVNGKVPSSQLPAADGYTKEETLKAATAALFGLGTDAVPDDVLAELGKYKQYWWRRRLSPREMSTSQEELTDYVVTTFPGTSSSNSITFSAADSFTLEDEKEDIPTLSLNDPVTQTASPVTMSAFTTKVAGKYVQFNATVTYYFPSDVALTRNGTNVVADKVTRITPIYTNNPGNAWQYLQSNSRSAYPDSGTSGGYEYEYLGIPFDNAVTAPKIETGSYVGTGTSGANGQNTLTFDFTPRIIFLNTTLVNPSNTIPRYFILLYPASTYAFDSNHRGGVTWNGNSVSWYSDGASYQMNTEGTTYQYIAIGG